MNYEKKCFVWCIALASMLAFSSSALAEGVNQHNNDSGKVSLASKQQDNEMNNTFGCNSLKRSQLISYRAISFLFVHL
ncbi:hypothetical protein [Aneurinibacillus terranovensis]|uniref:hypothetical protein n=1 Tax=Aneurinibacillus terranovensis TaxID=278991 RepID=UPI0012DBDEA6